MIMAAQLIWDASDSKMLAPGKVTLDSQGWMWKLPGPFWTILGSVSISSQMKGFFIVFWKWRHNEIKKRACQINASFQILSALPSLTYDPVFERNEEEVEEEASGKVDGLQLDQLQYWSCWKVRSRFRDSRSSVTLQPPRNGESNLQANGGRRSHHSKLLDAIFHGRPSERVGTSNWPNREFSGQCPSWFPYRVIVGLILPWYSPFIPMFGCIHTL